jgi:hypothetical protein
LVTIELIANPRLKPHSSEVEAAHKLSAILAASLEKGEQGKILIMPSLKVYGSRCKDIDLTVFANFDTPIRRRIKCRTGGKTPDQELRMRQVSIKSFCMILEVKRHDERGIRWKGSQAEVLYDGEWSNVSEQSSEQNVSLRTFFEDTIEWKPSPYVGNLIWFTELARDGLKEHRQNFLPGNFSFEELLTLHCRQAFPIKLGKQYDENCFLKCTATEAEDAELNIKKAMNHFEVAKYASGALTREKLEAIIRDSILRNQEFIKSLGHRLVVVRGRAGTGKTMKILHLAHDLATEQGKRCLVLTYNLALVSDIRRLIALANIDLDASGGKLEVRSIHSFMMDLFDVFNIECDPDLDFGQRYEIRRGELHRDLGAGLLNQDDVTKALSRAPRIRWDFLFVDEGQDWPLEERDILFRIYGSDHFVVADGMDQLVRTQQHTDWTDAVECHKPVISEKRSWRQKSNLIRFQAAFADAMDLPQWDVKTNEKLSGGRVEIHVGPYTKKLHDRLVSECKQSKNAAYDMLFLTPPSLVGRMPDNKRFFSLRDSWQRELGISLWDGTAADTRSEFPTRVEQHRLFQYDSCRGLEGWSAICLNFDDFFEYKIATHTVDTASGLLALRSSEEEAKLFAARWCMVPLTRAVDTLILVIRDEKSKMAGILRKVANELDGIVSWER